MTKAYKGIQVLDLSDRLSGAFASRLFGDFGARVVMGEQKSGHPIRSDDTLHRYVNWNKKSVYMPLDNLEKLHDFLVSSDVVISNFVSPNHPTFQFIENNKPESSIHLSITPHGLTGNLAGIDGNNLTACARTGFSYINAYEHEPPLQLPNNITGYVAGVAGFILAASTLFRRRSTGVGEKIDLSEIESLAITCHPWGIQAIFQDMGDCLGVSGGAARGIPKPLWEAKDGLINFGFGDFRNWSESMKLMNLSIFQNDTDLIPDIGRHGSPKMSEVIAAAAGTVKDIDRERLFHGLSKLRSICGMVRDVKEIYECAHLNDRNYFVQVPGKERHIKYPGPTGKTYPLEWNLSLAAPNLHENDQNSEWDFEKSFDAGSNLMMPSSGPLSGVKVLTFAHAWSGPFAAEILGLLGAEVVQIEAPHRVDVWRRVTNQVPYGVRNPKIDQHILNAQGLYNSTNLNKRAITLNMSTDEGRRIFWELVPHFDILLENFTPNIMKRWGVTLETLEEVRPGIVFASLSAYGATGPFSEYPGNGGTTEPMSGLSSIHGYEGDTGMNTGGMIPDPISGYFLVASIVSALHARDKSGKGQRIESSMIEAMSTVVGDAVGAFQETDYVQRPMGNRHPQFAPHNVFRCKDDEWVAIAVQNDVGWKNFAYEIGLSQDGRFHDQNKRKLNEDVLDELISDWANEMVIESVIEIVNKSGNLCARVTPLYEIYTKPDPDMLDRGFISSVQHPETGENWLPTRPWKFGSGPSSKVTPSPCVGQHSREVLNEYIGVSGEEYDELVRNNVTGTIYEYERNS
mgnify:FL=1